MSAPKGIDEARYKRCKEKVKRTSPGVNEYAVCAASLQGKSKKSKKGKGKMKKSLFPEPITYSMDKKAKQPERTKKDVCYDIEDNIRRLKSLKELTWTVQEDAPEAKKALENKYKSIQGNITKLAKEYSSLKKSIKDLEEGEPMKKSREELVTEYTEKVKNGEMTVEDVEKAMQAGYQSATPEGHNDKVEEVDAAAAVKDSGEAAEVSEEANDDSKFSDGLFNKNFTLGATLVQTPAGNVMANVKKPAMDYEKTYEESTKNIKVDRADYKKD